MIKSVKYLFAVIALFCCSNMNGQDDGYMMEIGVAGGGSFYMGDANNSALFRNTNGMAGVVARYNFNPRWSLKADLVAAGLEGDTREMKSAFPCDDIHFSRTVYDFGVQLEVGFLGYGKPPLYNCYRFAPYYTFGIGTTFAPKPLENVIAVNFPVGIGFRYKLAERVNIGMEWTMRFSTTDKIDVTELGNGFSLEDPFLAKGKGMKNKDSYSFTMVFLTFDIFKRPCDCNNE